jgi:hypothetical protein
LLPSIPRQEFGMKALGESESGHLELRMRACSIGKWSGQERRVVGGVLVYIGLSKESSRWAKIQNLDNVRGCPTMSGWPRQSLTGSFCDGNLNSGLTRVGSDNVRPDVYFGWVGRDLKFARLNNFYFIHYAPLNSTVFLFSRNINRLKTRLSSFKDPSIELLRIGGGHFSVFSFLVT